MRVNVYAEEMTDRVEIVHKTRPGDSRTFVGLRFPLSGEHGSAVTIWAEGGIPDLGRVLSHAIKKLELQAAKEEFRRAGDVYDAAVKAVSDQPQAWRDGVENGKAVDASVPMGVTPAGQADQRRRR